MHKHLAIDWTGCELTERISGKQGGAALVNGTRVPAQQLVDEYQLGESAKEIAENYEIPLESVRRIIAFAEQPKPMPV